MSVRRAAALSAVLAAVAASVVLGPAPASADDLEVRLRVPDTFTAGWSPGSVSVQITQDGIEGCALVAMTLGIELDDLQPRQVQVAVASGGQWRAVDLTQEADGRFVTPHVPPDQPEICRERNRSTSIRFQVVFLAGVQPGEAKFETVARSGTGEKLGDDSDTAKVVAGRGATASPTRTSSPTPSPTPGATATAPADVATTAAAASVAIPVSGDGESGVFGAGTLAIILGVVMVGGGVALLVVMIRRMRGGGADQEGGDGNDPWPQPGGGGPWPFPGNGPGPYPSGSTPEYGPGGTALLPQLGGLPPAGAGGDSNPTQILPVVPNNSLQSRCG